MHAPHEEAPRATATLPHSIASPSAGSQSAPPQQPPPITFAPAHQQDPSPTYYPAAAPAQASYPPQQPPQQQQQQQAAPPAAAAAQPSAQPSPRFGRGAPPEAQNYPCVQWLFDVCSEPTRLAGGWLVTLVLCLYAWTYFTFVVVHCIWLVMPNLPGLAAFYLAVFHVVWPLVIVSYLRAVYSDPGCVPKSLPLTPAQQQEVTAARQAAANGEPLRGRRYCFKCDAPKPERTHHCSICNRCRMRFDHHCPWISNCVGYGNHKFFVLFMFWTVVMCILIIAFTTQSLVMVIRHFIDGGRAGINEVGILVTYGLSVVVVLSLSGFTSFHLQLIAQNTTTIEMYLPRAVTKSGLEVSRYDVGKRPNIEALLGRSALVWFLPTLWSREGDGTQWPVRDDLEEET